MTEKQWRALELFKHNGPTTTAGFGMMMWPDSPARLTGLNRSAGKMISTLRKLGLIQREPPIEYPEKQARWYLTREAERALEQRARRRPVCRK
ncbi:MAG: hypothetical protein KAJ19_20625 [Gammaproteobacteria bacterium]|nr:hypothetical protein [Gammaproteobacteria bacterium]